MPDNATDHSTDHEERDHHHGRGDRPDATDRSLSTITLGGGCFWCLDAVYRRVRGVHRVVSGYAGGRRPDPTYEQVCSGATGHAEVVQLSYDPEVISTRELLEIFFGMHDPTTLDRQGGDVGSQYRSVIFHHDEAQREEAAALMDELTASRTFDAPIVTRLEPAPRFYPAEAYHQDYASVNPDQGYCRVVISPKVAKLRSRFADKLASV
ncbi:MAG: peptide-methionine (S)-S-oxide reductase MsrA [Gemmatimonadaceae bacterium]